MMRFVSAISLFFTGTSALCPELQELYHQAPEDWWTDEAYIKDVNTELEKLDHLKVFPGIEDSTATLFDDERTPETDLMFGFTEADYMRNFFGEDGDESQVDWFLVSCSETQRDVTASQFVGTLQWMAAILNGEYRIACVEPGTPFADKIMVMYDLVRMPWLMMFTREEDGSWLEHEMLSQTLNGWLPLADFITDERGLRYQLTVTKNPVTKPPKDFDLIKKEWNMKVVNYYQYWLEVPLTKFFKWLPAPNPFWERPLNKLELQEKAEKEKKQNVEAMKAKLGEEDLDEGDEKIPDPKFEKTEGE